MRDQGGEEDDGSIWVKVDGGGSGVRSGFLDVVEVAVAVGFCDGEEGGGGVFDLGCSIFFRFVRICFSEFPPVKCSIWRCGSAMGFLHFCDGFVYICFSGSGRGRRGAPWFVDEG